MTYTCLTCDRDVDPDLEPSPGEPTRCADCSADLARELDERISAGLRNGWSGIA